jgi:AcrR family transcriptional regulator
MGRPSKDEARKTREDILSAALDLFAEQGFAGTSVRQIAQAVGVAESALYYHFRGGKDEILKAVVAEVVASRTKPFAFDEGQDWGDAAGVGALLHRLADRVLDSWSSPREQKLFRLVQREGPRLVVSGITPDDVVRVEGTIARFFAQLVRRRLIREFDGLLLAWQFLAPMVMLRMRLLFTGETDVRKLRPRIHQHVDFFVEAVRR